MLHFFAIALFQFAGFSGAPKSTLGSQQPTSTELIGSGDVAAIGSGGWGGDVAAIGSGGWGGDVAAV